MGSLVPFGDYDIIAYLMVGLAMFMALDLVFGLGLLYRSNWNTGSVTGIVLLAYLGGHLMAIPSKFVFEHWVVDFCLKRPLIHLVQAPIVQHYPAAENVCAAISWVAPQEFFLPASPDVLNRIPYWKKGSQLGDDRTLFHEAFVTAKHDPNSYERMQIFQRLYLLFRNMGVLDLIGMIAVLFKRTLTQFRLSTRDEHLIFYGVKRWMIRSDVQFGVFLLLTLGLLNRFLYFYWLYAAEVLTAYAYATALPNP